MEVFGSANDFWRLSSHKPTYLKIWTFAISPVHVQWSRGHGRLPHFNKVAVWVAHVAAHFRRVNSVMNFAPREDQTS